MLCPYCLEVPVVLPSTNGGARSVQLDKCVGVQGKLDEETIWKRSSTTKMQAVEFGNLSSLLQGAYHDIQKCQKIKTL